MEEKEEKPIEEKPMQTSSPKSSKFNIWKIITLILVAVILVGGGYYLAIKDGSRVYAPTPTPQASASPTAQDIQTPSNTPSTSAMPSKTPSKIIEAGQAGEWIFIPYKISVPADWTVDHQSTKDIADDLKITQGGYKISIRQAGGEGLKCLYGNEPEEPFTQKYKYYVEFSSLDETFRRSGEIGGTGWTLCHKIPDGWGFPPIYGYISYSTPPNPDEKILKQMDLILSTIVKQ